MSGPIPPGPPPGAPPPPPSAPPPPPPPPYDGPATPLEPLEYHQIQRAGRQGWWWSLLGAVVMLVTFAVLGPLLLTIPIAIVLIARYGSSEGSDRLVDLANTDNTTPSVLLYVFVLLIVSLPGAWLVQRVMNGLRPRWLASVAPRIRWRWLAASFGVAFVALLVAIVLGTVLPSGSEDLSTSGGVNDFTSTSRDFLLIVLLCVPLQAAAEEYVFRGYLTQAFGSLVRDVWVARGLAVVVPALIFALFHGLGQSAPIFADRFLFGLSAGVLVIATGGLEAGIAYHVLNNLLAFTIAIFYGDMSEALNPTGGGWADVVVSFVKSAIFVGLSILTARKLGVQTRTDPTVLVGPRARV